MSARLPFTLSQFPGSVFLIAGTEDRLLGRKRVLEILRLRPDAEIRWVEAPHLITTAKPQETWECIVEFVHGLAQEK